MEIDYKWRVKTYKDPTEHELHWNLRKRFIITHKKKYPEARLVALSKVFANMEFMGCIYNSELMLLVRNLAKEVPQIVKYWEEKKSKISRTFVTASDAVRRNTDPRPLKPLSKKQKRKLEEQNLPQIIPNKKFKLNQSEDELLCKVRSQPGVKSRIIIYNSNNNDKNILLQSMAKCKLQMKFETLNRLDVLKTHIVKIGEEVITELKTEEVYTKTIQWELSRLALEELRKYCFTIEPKDDKKAVSKTDTNKISTFQTKDTSALHGGIGAKIMQKMGWKGTGLGKEESGIEKPIEASINVRKLGLGMVKNVSIDAFRKQMTKYLEDYVHSDDDRPLQFSSEFTKDQRKCIHKLIGRMPLKSQSYGTGDDRALRIYKKIDGWDLIVQLLANGDSTSAWSLIRPTHIE